MTWPKRLIAVPTSALHVDPAISVQSPKYSQQELREIAAAVPAVYDKIAQGWMPGDFAAAQWSQDPKEHQLGTTYNCLFNGSTGQALSASYDGQNLIVDSGNHRILAARSIGVPVLPVQVSAHTDTALNQVEQACSRRIEKEGFSQYRDAHFKDAQNRNARQQISKERERELRTPGCVRGWER
jgi:hypothetical protein